MSYTHPAAWQWYATADDLINIRGWYSVNGVPVPTRKQDGQQQGFFKTKSDQESRKNYQMFYAQHYGSINKFGKKEYWELKPEYITLQQTISDRFDIITYKPDNTINQSKHKGSNTAISTKPKGIVKEAIPIKEIAGMSEYEEELRIKTGGKTPKSYGTAIPTMFFPVIPEAAAQQEPSYIMSANIQITFTDSSIGGFSTSIDVKDIGKLQGIMNDRYANKAKYTLIGSSTNPPLKTMDQVLNDIETLLSRPAPPAPPAPPTDVKTITPNMITQHVDSFTIENGRAKGQITFKINDNFNPYYYNKNIVNVIQLKTKEGVNILQTIKQNRLRFTATERDEVIQYDESVNNNTIVDLESFVWLNVTQPTSFSPVLKRELKEGQEATTTEGFLGAGLALSSIAFAIIAGYLIDMRRKK
jgi:hypothetical protein